MDQPAKQRLLEQAAHVNGRYLAKNTRDRGAT